MKYQIGDRKDHIGDRKDQIGDCRLLLCFCLGAEEFCAREQCGLKQTCAFLNGAFPAALTGSVHSASRTKSSLPQLCCPHCLSAVYVEVDAGMKDAGWEMPTAPP